MNANTISEDRAETTLPTHDPVCGMQVARDRVSPQHEFGGRAYRFCRRECQQKFIQTPEFYLEANDPVCGARVVAGRSTRDFDARYGAVLFLFLSLPGEIRDGSRTFC